MPFSVFYVSLTKTWDLLVVFIVACRGYSYLVFLICFPELLKKEMLVFKHFVCPHIVFFLCSFLIGLNYKIIEIYVHIFGVVIRPRIYFLFLVSNTWLLMNTEILLRWFSLNHSLFHLCIWFSFLNCNWGDLLFCFCYSLIAGSLACNILHWLIKSFLSFLLICIRIIYTC